MAKSFASALLLLGIVLSATLILYGFQTNPVIKTEGVYPGVRPLTTGQFHFYSDRIEVKLADPPPVGRIAVFAYDKEERQVVILKPVQGDTVTIFPGDLADYRVVFRNPYVVKDFEILRESHGFKGAIDFF